MRIYLTEPQIRQIMPFFDRVQATAQLGNPGMLVAQIRWHKHDGVYWMEPGFLQHEHAKLIAGKGEGCVDNG